MKALFRSLIIAIALLALTPLPAAAVSRVSENEVSTMGWLFPGTAALNVQTVDGIHYTGTIRVSATRVFTLHNAVVGGKTGQSFTGYLTTTAISVRRCSYCTPYPVPAGTHFPFKAWLGEEEFRGSISFGGFLHPFCGGVDYVPANEKRCYPPVPKPER